MKRAQRMIRRNTSQQRLLLLRRGILRPGNKLRLQYFALTQLVFQGQARMGEHVPQALQCGFKCRNRHLKEKVGSALAGAGIHLSTLALHVGHQPVACRKTPGTQEQ